jgi:hypothetical protein
MKRMFRFLYRIIGKIEKNSQKAFEGKKAFVVIGFQRSGTSMVCDMLNRAGVYFGDSKELMAPDSRNPNGFFEHKRLFKLCRKFLKESGKTMDYNFNFGKQLKAEGYANRFSRFFTRISIMNILSAVSSKKEVFGIKSFPIFWYFVKPYFPKERTVIAVFRNPFSVATSFETAWPGRFNVSQVIHFWTTAHKDMIFHLSAEKNFVLISYEDLLDIEKRKNIVQKMSEISGLDSSKLESVFDDKLNRSGGRASRLKETYPLPEETEKVLASLEKMKI